MRSLLGLYLCVWLGAGCSQDDAGLSVELANRDDGVVATYVATNGVVLTVDARSDGTTVTSAISHDGLAVTRLTTPDNGRGEFTADPMPLLSQGIQHTREVLDTMRTTPRRLAELTLAYRQLFAALADHAQLANVPQLQHALGLHEAIYAQARLQAIRPARPPGAQTLLYDDTETPGEGFPTFDSYYEWDVVNDGDDDVGPGEGPAWQSPGAEQLSTQDPAPVEDHSFPSRDPVPARDRMGSYAGDVAGYLRDGCPGAMGPGCSWCSVGPGDSSVSCWETSFSIWHDRHCGAWLEFFSCHQ